MSRYSQNTTAARAAFDAGQIRQQLPAQLSPLQPLPLSLGAYLNWYGLARLARVAEYRAARLAVAGAELVVQQFCQRGPSRGRVVLVHGYMDHAGLTRPLAAYLFRRGWDLVLYDLPGHGLSAGPCYEVEDFFHYADQLGDLLRQLLPQADTPLTLIGHSTGAAIITTLLLREPALARTPLTQPILLAPLVRPSHWRSIRRKYQVLRFLLRRVRRFYKRNSHDRRFLNFVRCHDPLQHEYIPVRWIGAMLVWIRWFEAQTPHPLRPLVIQGSADATVDWQHNLQVLARLFPNGEQRLIEGARHNLINEAGRWRRPVYRMVAAALQERVADD